MAKEISAFVKLQIEGGKASPAPPVGTALGPHGIAIMDFVKEYNARTADKLGEVIPVEITIYQDKSFTFITKTPPAVEYIKKAAKIDKGSPIPHINKVGKIKKSDLLQIAKEKMEELNAHDLESASKMIEGTARSMGIEVIEG
jgi:large subunit ribosomal protein L11